MPSFHRDCLLESGALLKHTVRVSFLSFDIRFFKKKKVSSSWTPAPSPRLPVQETFTGTYFSSYALWLPSCEDR